MMMLDVFTLTLLFLLTLVVLAIVLMNVYQRGHRAGEELGRAAERALWWERTAVAQARVDALGSLRVEDHGAEWELPEEQA
jgi:hypothetical protein